MLRELEPLLQLDCMTIGGETLGDRIAAERDAYVDTINNYETNSTFNETWMHCLLYLPLHTQIHEKGV